MALRLSPEQWGDLVNASKDGCFTQTESWLAAGDTAAAADDLTSSLVFVLALEGRSVPDPTWSVWQRALDSLVQMAQPAPSITHVELIVPPQPDGKQNMHFSTYVFETAQWWDSHANNRSFYLGSNAPHWRAVPLSCKSAASRVRQECGKHVGTAYSLSRYVCAVPPVRALASLLPDAPLSPAHCGTLTARVLKRALGEVAPVHASGWYGPSSLFLEMSDGEKREATSHFLTGSAGMQSIVEKEEEAAALSGLLNGSDDRVRSLADEACRSAIRSLSTRACSDGLDEAGRRIVQKQLATALLRYSIVNRM